MPSYIGLSHSFIHLFVFKFLADRTATKNTLRKCYAVTLRRADIEADSHYKTDKIREACPAEGIVGKSCTDGQIADKEQMVVNN